MCKISTALMAAACVTMMQTTAFAEPITPSKIAYHAKTNENNKAKVCQLILDFTSPLNPEVVEFAALVGWEKTNQLVVTAFTVAVLDVSSDAKNKPAQFAKLASVGFSAEKFNSAGLVQQPSSDRSVWVWTDHDNTLAFMEAFIGGNFQVIFTREKHESPHVYQIQTGPSEDVQREFAACIASLAPKLSERGNGAGGGAGRAEKPGAVLKEILPQGSDQAAGAASRQVMETAPREKPMP